MPYWIVAIECLLVAVWWSLSDPAFPPFAWFSQAAIKHQYIYTSIGNKKNLRTNEAQIVQILKIFKKRSET